MTAAEHAAKQRAYCEQNREKVAAKDAAYYEKNRERVLDYGKQWRAKNPDYYQKNRAKLLANAERYRRKRGAMPKQAKPVKAPKLPAPPRVVKPAAPPKETKPPRAVKPPEPPKMLKPLTPPKERKQKLCAPSRIPVVSPEKAADMVREAEALRRWLNGY
jgi:hypothetical protein